MLIRKAQKLLLNVIAKTIVLNEYPQTGDLSYTFMNSQLRCAFNWFSLRQLF